MKTYLIALCLAAGILSAAIAALMAMRAAPQIVDGVSSPEWFENIKPIRY